MSFRHPAVLIALLSLVPLAWMFLWRVRRRRYSTPVLFLWERVIESNQHAAMGKRWRDLFSFLLLALACVGMTLAGAGPEWEGQEHRDLVVLIDNSLSMSSDGGHGSRLEAAKRRARELVANWPPNQRVAIASVARGIEFRSHFSSNPKDWEQAIRSIEPTYWEFRPGILSEVPQHGDSPSPLRVLLVTDACWDRAGLPNHVEIVPVDATGENVGIIAADCRPLAGQRGKLGVLIQCYSSSSDMHEMNLRVLHVSTDGERLFKVLPIRLTMGINDPLVFTLEDVPYGRWHVTVDYADSLPQDNEAYLYVAEPDPVPVSIDTENSYFYKRSVEAFANQGNGLTLVQNVSGSNGPVITVAEEHDSGAARQILFHPIGTSPFWSDVGDVVEVVPQKKPSTISSLRHVETDNIDFVGARRITVPRGAEIWLESEEGVPLIYQAHDGIRTAVVVNLEPEAAGLFLSANFPILVHSLATFLADRQDVAVGTVPIGSPLALDGIPLLLRGVQAAPAKMVTPSGENRIIVNNHFVADVPGFYVFEAKDKQHVVAVSVVSTHESQVRRDTLPPARLIARGGVDYGIWLTWLSLGVLCAESILYHMGKVG